MIALLKDIDKHPYRSIELSLFDKKALHPDTVIRKKFQKIERFEYDLMGHEDLFEKLLIKFKEKYPQFCISSGFEEDPIFLFDLRTDMIREYYGIINYPKIINLTSLPDLNAGLSITNEKIYFYNPDQNWCLYADRYYDLILLFYRSVSHRPKLDRKSFGG